MLVRKPHSKYWYIVLREGRKHKWFSTRLEDEASARAVHDEMVSKRNEAARQQKISFLLGGRALESTARNKPLLLSQAWDKYCSINPKWGDASRKIFNHFSGWAGINKDISDIDSDAALEFLGNYRECSGKTFNNYRTALSKIWKVLKSYSNIRENIWQDIANRSTESEYHRPITSTEYAAILKATKGFWHDATIISYYTGLRRKDIQILQWSQIKGTHIELVPSKTSANQKSVIIPIHQEVRKVLDYRAKKSEYVFPREAEKLHNGTFNKEFGIILDGLGITATPPAMVGFRSLRTAFVTRCAEAGVSDKAIGGMVGHGSVKQTRHYDHDMKSAKKILRLKDK